MLFLPVGVPLEYCFGRGVCGAGVSVVVFGRRGVHADGRRPYAALTCFLGGMTMALLLAFGHTGMYAAGRDLHR